LGEGGKKKGLPGPLGKGKKKRLIVVEKREVWGVVGKKKKKRFS